MTYRKFEVTFAANYPYSNPGTNVTGYEVDADRRGKLIRVRFRDGSVYTYTEASAGRQAIDDMERLAEAGAGLNAYINRHARHAWASKA